MNKDTRLISEAYDNVLNRVQGQRPTYVGNNHEGYKNVFISRHPRIKELCEYTTESSAPFFLVAVNDEGPDILYEGNTLEELVQATNRGPGWDETLENDEVIEVPNNFTLTSLIERVKETVADKDSSSAYIIVDANRRRTIAQGQNIEVYFSLPSDDN